jgi:hypothetical protein
MQTVLLTSSKAHLKWTNMVCHLAKRSIRLTSNSNQDEKITTHNRKKYNKPPPIDLKSVRTNQQESEAKSKNTGKINAFAMLCIPVITFGLGVWQVKRRERKLEMIKFLEDRTRCAAIELPKDPQELESLTQTHEYQPFKVKGRFLHSKEIILTIK